MYLLLTTKHRCTVDAQCTVDKHKLQPVITAKTALLQLCWLSISLPAQVGEDHLQEEDAHAVHVKLVWVVETPQDGGQEGCHRQRGRPGGLHAANNVNNNVWAFLLMMN